MRQLNIRIPDELDDALQAHVNATGEKQSATVRRGIQLAIGQRAGEGVPPPTGQPSPAAESPSPEGIASEPRPSRANGSGPDSAAPSGDTVDFATWLAGRSGMPRAILVRRITAGKVEIDGRPRYAERIPAADLRGQVTLDGNPL